MDCPVCLVGAESSDRYCSSCGARLAAKETGSLPLESEHRFRTYVEHAPHGVFIVDERGRYVEVNSAACRITGYDKSELLRMTIPDTLPADFLLQGLASFSQVRETGFAQAELPFVGKGGRRGWWSVDAVKLSDSRFLGYVTDITARKVAEDELRRERDFRQRLLDTAPIIVLWLDLAGRIRHFNRFMEELSGYRLEDVQGKDWFSIFLPERDRDRIRSLYRTAVSGMPTRGNRNPIVTRTGEEREIQWSDEHLFDDKGRMVGVLAVGQDVTELYRSEAELRLKDALVGNMFAGAAVTRMSDGAIIYANRQFAELFGYEPQELIGRNANVLNAGDPQAAADLSREVITSISTNGFWRGELLNKKKDGTPFWTRASVVLFQHAEFGEVAVGVQENVNERKLAADRDAERLAKLKRLADLSLKLSGDPAAVFTHVVRMIGELFDVPVVCLSEIVGQELLFKAVYLDGQVVTDAGSCPLEITPCATVEQTKDLQVFDHVAERYPRASFLREHNADSYCGFPSIDAEERVVAVTCLLDSRPRKFSDEDQQILKVIGQRIALEVERNRSLEARRRDRDAFRESEERLRILVENAPAGVAMLDRDLRYLAYSRRWLSDYQLGDQELFGRSHYEVFPEIPERWKEIHRRCLTGVSEQCEEDTFERPDGSVDYLRWEIQPWRDAAGAVGGLVFFTELITDRKRSEQQLGQLRDELAHVARLGTMGEMASGLAHELNQPLTALQLYASAALELGQASDDSTLRDCLRGIREQSLRAGEIIRRMRSFVRRSPSRRMPADVNQLVREVLLLLGHDLRHGNVEVELGLDEHLPLLQIDGIQIQQVLVNLIRNAMEAMSDTPKGGRTLSVRTQWADEGVQISVTDTGCGIDPGLVARLFQPFQSTRSTGLGLGLAISRTLIEAHGGRISAHGNPDRGATFFFYLPAAHDEASA